MIILFSRLVLRYALLLSRRSSQLQQSGYAFAELFRNFINFVVGLIALPLKADIAQTFSETEPNVARI
jgi:hypothetical protein